MATEVRAGEAIPPLIRFRAGGARVQHGPDADPRPGEGLLRPGFGESADTDDVLRLELPDDANERLVAGREQWGLLVFR